MGNRNGSLSGHGGNAPPPKTAADLIGVQPLIDERLASAYRDLCAVEEALQFIDGRPLGVEQEQLVLLAQKILGLQTLNEWRVSRGMNSLSPGCSNMPTCCDGSPILEIAEEGGVA